MADIYPVAEKYQLLFNKIVGAKGWRLMWEGKQKAADEKFQLGRYCLEVDGKEVASFEVHQMINCCGIAVSTRAWVSTDWRGKGLGTLLNSLRIDIARDAGFGLLLCTDIESNEHQRKILRKNGWRDIHSFVNPRTKNRVYISVLGL